MTKTNKLKKEVKKNIKVTVIKSFKGEYNNHIFDCTVGDIVEMSQDEINTYSRFIKKD